MILRIIPSLFLLFHLFPFTTGVLVNVSIDDTLGDELNGNQISYTPSTAWKLGQSCSDCGADVDASQPFEHTWHDGTFFTSGSGGAILSASVLFNGVAVYVVCIVPGALTNAVGGDTDMTFLLDGSEVSNLNEPFSAAGNATYIYDQIVFSRTDLPPGVHTIQIDVGRNNAKALILLDRIIYTTDVSDPVNSLESQLPQLTLTVTNVISTPSSTSGVPRFFEMNFAPRLVFITIFTGAAAALCLP